MQRMHDSNLTHTGEHTSVKYMNLSKVFDTRFSIFFFYNINFTRHKSQIKKLK